MNDSKRKNFRRILKCIEPHISLILEKVPDVDNLCEIRLRAQKPIVLRYTDCNKFLLPNGRVTSFLTDGAVTANKSDVENTFNLLCGYSVHSYTESIANGFITLDGGNRAGVYGTAVTQNGNIVSVRNVNGINFRIAGMFENIAEDVVEQLYCTKRINTLICGPPSSGKTTMIKSMCRILSDKMNYNIAVVDEREEFSEYIGYNTDVLSRYPKAMGIQIAIRTLSPDIIVCDEIGTDCEVEKIEEGMNSGVSFIMSIHCSNAKELSKKSQFISLSKIGAVDECVMLSQGKCVIDRIVKASEIDNENYCADNNGNSLCAFRSVHGF